jgi:hypothetical protein
MKETTYSHGHCPSGWPIRGAEVHTYWTGGSQYTGTNILNVQFENFGNTGCVDSTAIRVDEEDRGYFDIRTQIQISRVTFDAKTQPISGCDAIDSGVDNFAVRDINGSIIANTPRMTIAPILAHANMVIVSSGIIGI